jgi:hypothetical protein
VYSRASTQLQMFCSNQRPAPAAVLLTFWPISGCRQGWCWCIAVLAHVPAHASKRKQNGVAPPHATATCREDFGIHASLVGRCDGEPMPSTSVCCNCSQGALGNPPLMLNALQMADPSNSCSITDWVWAKQIFACILTLTPGCTSKHPPRLLQRQQGLARASSPARRPAGYCWNPSGQSY